MHLVSFQEQNALGTMHGGEIPKVIDKLAIMVAMRHAEKICVTRVMGALNYRVPLVVGDVLELAGSVNRVWETSLEVGVKIWKHDRRTRARLYYDSVYVTAVAVGEDLRPVFIGIPLILGSRAEKRRWREAGARRARQISEEKRKRAKQ